MVHPYHSNYSYLSYFALYLLLSALIVRVDGSLNLSEKDQSQKHNISFPEWSPSGDEIAYRASNSNKVYILDWKKRELSFLMKAVKKGIFNHSRVQYSPDGKKLFIDFINNQIHYYDFTEKKHKILQLKENIKIIQAAFSTDSRSLYLPAQITRIFEGSLLSGVKILVLDLVTGLYQEPTSNYFRNISAHTCFFSHKRNHMAHIDYTRSIISIRKVPKAEEVSRYTAYTIEREKSFSLCWSAKDEYIFSFEKLPYQCPNTYIQVWDSYTGNAIYTLRRKGTTSQIACSSDGNYCAFLNISGDLEVHKKINLTKVLAVCNILHDLASKIALFVGEYPYFNYFKKFRKCLKPYFLTWSPCGSFLLGEKDNGIYVLDVFSKR